MQRAKGWGHPPMRGNGKFTCWAHWDNMYGVLTAAQVAIFPLSTGLICSCCFSRKVLGVKFSMKVAGHPEIYSEETGA